MFHFLPLLFIHSNYYCSKLTVKIRFAILLSTDLLNLLPTSLNEFPNLPSSIAKFDKLILVCDFNLRIDSSNWILHKAFHLVQHVNGRTQWWAHPGWLFYSWLIFRLSLSYLLFHHKCIIFATVLQPVSFSKRTIIKHRIFNENTVATFLTLLRRVNYICNK